MPLRRRALFALPLMLTSSYPAVAASADATRCLTNGSSDPACAGGVTGTVQPFRLHHASRLRLSKGSIAQTGVSAAVETGEPVDWLATAVYLAEQVTQDGSEYIKVTVFRESPWGDDPPQQYKVLAKVGLTPTDPPEQRWIMSVARRMPTVIDIEADVLTAELYDPGEHARVKRPKETPEDTARRLVIQRHQLPRTWKSSPELGVRGVNLPRKRINVVVPSSFDVAQLRSCLRAAQTGITRCQ